MKCPKGSAWPVTWVLACLLAAGCQEKKDDAAPVDDAARTGGAGSKDDEAPTGGARSKHDDAARTGGAGSKDDEAWTGGAGPKDDEVPMGGAGPKDDEADGEEELLGELVGIDEGDADPNEMCRPVSVAVGMQHTCAVTALGRLVCSGTIAESPVTPPEGVFQAVSSGDWQSCAIDEDGEVRCWGEIYTPSATEVLRAPAPETFPGKFRAVAAGGSLACGIRTDDTLACWGDEVALAGMPDSGTFTSVAVGTMHACAIRTEGTLVCWGFGSEGETDAPAGKFQAISAGNYRTCAVRIDGSIACWGAGDDLPPPAGPFAQVSVGGDPGSYLWYACATRDDGSAECWGKSSSPAGPLDGAFMSLSTGSYQVCAVDLDCVVSCTPRTP